MGNKSSVLTAEQLDEYVELTYLSKSEILYILKKFSSIAPEYFEQDFHFRFNQKYIARAFPQLELNPFNDRIFKVFSSKSDNNFSFDDFIDLCSVMSENCPLNVKAKWAFKIFDMDDDGVISKNDIANIIDCLLSNPEDIKEADKYNIGTEVINDVEIVKKNAINSSEFEHMIARMPEFANAFYFKP